MKFTTVQKSIAFKLQIIGILTHHKLLICDNYIAYFSLLLELSEHDNDVNFFLCGHSPEVIDGLWQGTLGGDECPRTSVALYGENSLYSSMDANGDSLFAICAFRMYACANMA